jgi:hypothetical protein
MAEFLGNQKIVYIPNEQMLDLERSFYEYEGLKTLVTQFASDTPFKPDMERFNILIEEYLKSYMEYNITFNQIVRTFLEKEDQVKNITASFQLSAMLID